MTDEEVTEWIQLVMNQGYGVILKPLPVAGSIAGTAQAAAAGWRDRDAADTQGNCQAELWKLPRPRDENGGPRRSRRRPTSRPNGSSTSPPPPINGTCKRSISKSPIPADVDQGRVAAQPAPHRERRLALR